LLAADENFSNDIVRGSTITHHAYERVRAGKPMPGVFEVGRSSSVGAVIEDILLLAECSLEAEWEGQVRYLPLR